MAGPAVSGLAGDLHDTSSVDADRRQDPAIADVTLYVTARGLTTSPIPYGERTFQIDFDFIEHALCIETSDSPRWQMPLHAKPVADFHAAVMAALSDVGIEVHIDVPTSCPTRSASARTGCMPRMMANMRNASGGGCSCRPIACSRHSARALSSDEVTREAYSHEVSSAGFWPGGGVIDYPAFYSYAYPIPDGFRSAPVQPEAAFFSQELGAALHQQNPRRRRGNSICRALPWLPPVAWHEKCVTHGVASGFEARRGTRSDCRGCGKEAGPK